MKEKSAPTLSEQPGKRMAAAIPVWEPDAALTPKAEAKAANKLPRAEQLKKFEEDLEAHDSGNQPS
jgi:hypothetical protein